MDEKDRRQAQKLYAALYNENEGERNAAAGRLYAFMRRHGVHPGDVHHLFAKARDDLVKDLVDTNRRLIERNEALTRENHYLRQNVKPADLRAFQRAGKVADHWPEVEDLIRTRLCGGRLGRSWRRMVVERIPGVTPALLKRWEEGLREVPQEVLDALRALPVPPEAPPAKPRRKAATTATQRRAKPDRAAKLNGSRKTRASKPEPELPLG